MCITHKVDFYDFFLSDIDECLDGTDRCSLYSLCVNSPGSYDCHRCGLGFRGNGMSCVDYDECEEGVHDCHKKATCINTVGSYRCSCYKGYNGNGKVCKGEWAAAPVTG